MRSVKRLSMFFAVVVVTASVAHAQEYNRFGKGPTTAGLTPPGYGVNSYSRGSVYYAPAPVVATSRANVNSAPAPAVATAPTTDERRSFSAEPSAPGALVPAAPVAPMTAASAVRGQQYNRFGKGPTTIGLTPYGYGRSR
jgi:hypothetical protein